MAVQGSCTYRSVNAFAGIVGASLSAEVFVNGVPCALVHGVLVSLCFTGGSQARPATVVVDGPGDGVITVRDIPVVRSIP